MYRNTDVAKLEEIDEQQETLNCRCLIKDWVTIKFEKPATSFKSLFWVLLAKNRPILNFCGLMWPLFTHDNPDGRRMPLALSGWAVQDRFQQTLLVPYLLISPR